MKADDFWVLTQIGGGQKPKIIGTPAPLKVCQSNRTKIKNEFWFKKFLKEYNGKVALVIRRQEAFLKCPVMNKHLTLIS